MINNESYDFIIINTEDGEKKKAELITKFNIEEQGEYVIYKLDGNYYGAKYEFDGTKTIIITDLNDNEKKILNDLFSKLGVEEC